MPKIYTDEFKQSALELLDDGMTQKQVCADLGISKSALQAWVRDSRLAEVLQTHSPVNMRVRAVSVYSHLWTVTLPTVRPFSTNSCASRSVVGEIGASVVVAVVRMRP